MLRGRSSLPGWAHPNLTRLAMLRPFAGGSVDTADNDIFGLGEDGAVTLSANTPNFVGGDYTDFTLNAGVTATAASDRPILIRATGTITIDGTLDASGAITLASFNQLLVGEWLPQPSGGGGGGGGKVGTAGDPGGSSSIETSPQAAILAIGPMFLRHGYGLGTFGSDGVGGAGGSATPSAGGDAGAPAASALATPALQAFTDAERVRTGIYAEMYAGGTPGALGLDGGIGGQGGGGTAGGAGGTPGVGGAGGGLIYLAAPRIVFGGAALLKANGANGTAGGNGTAGTGADSGNNGGGGGGGGASGGQGGSGGVIGVYYGTSTSGSPTTQVNAGAGGAHGVHGAGGTGNGTGANGGAGSDGLDGLAGVAGFVFVRRIGHK